MHLVFFTRGNKKDVDEVIKHLECHPFLLPFKTPDGREGLSPIGGLIQPIQLWSFAFPENYKDKVLNSLCGQPKQQWTYNKKTELAIAAMRKGLGLEKIPEFKKDQMLWLPMPSIENIAITPVGIKKDDMNFKDPNGTIHEAI